jgi:hypothetical protein
MLRQRSHDMSDVFRKIQVRKSQLPRLAGAVLVAVVVSSLAYSRTVRAQSAAAGGYDLDVAAVLRNARAYVTRRAPLVRKPRRWTWPKRKSAF